MGKVHPCLDESLITFIHRQRCFFVATAPTSSDGYVNTSPKGYETFTIVDNHTVAYLDYPGSGNETARHIADNGRLTIMFCGFAEDTQIVRLYGTGEVIDKGDERFGQWADRFPERYGEWTRQIIVLHIEQVKSSCGMSVPYYEYRGERELLHNWAVNMEDKGKLDAYIAKNK
ncbi:pyridoxamine 5'-phosphate oxidase family protein [Paenibacillus sp. GCM10023252]|uniref:pyridoxamine 5'-phosphate oxidase family protein n=1 Tax=Paenibacillus sp. GCM10023252 TaxID=3252649 RepID=UPI00360B4979